MKKIKFKDKKNGKVITMKSNPELQKTIETLRKKAYDEKSNLWLRIAEDLEKPSRQRIAVNVSRINRVAKEGETIIVPGKVLASGDLEKNVTVIAWQFSNSALKKISEKGKALSLKEALKSKLEGKIRIVG